MAAHRRVSGAIIAALVGVSLFFVLAAADHPDLGISFDETMSGFYSLGDLPYQEAYNEGKTNGNVLQFKCAMTAPHMRAFLADNSHALEVVGTLKANAFTDLSGSKITEGVLNLFNGSIGNHEIEMNYFLPFTGIRGQQFYLEGVKHIRGDNCTHLFHMATTLYSHIRAGNVRGEGAILATGIVQIDFVQVLALLASLHVVGNGTDADKLDALSEFSHFLLQDISGDCLNITNWESQFWYIWATDGKSGFLLDLIARPGGWDVLEVRLETYTINGTVTVTKQYASVEDLFVSGSSVEFAGVVEMTEASCTSNMMQLNLSYDVTTAKNDFVPVLVYAAFGGLLPQIESKYGQLTQHSSVGPLNFAAGTPLVHTTYTFEVGLKTLQWAMISCLSFANSDLRLELVSARLPGANASYLGSSYVYHYGTEYHLNDPLVEHTKVVDGGDIANGTRLFRASIQYGPKLHLNVECLAPTQLFATLEQEGATTIHTTVLGSCVVEDVPRGDRLECNNQALLETKRKSD